VEQNKKTVMRSIAIVLSSFTVDEGSASENRKATQSKCFRRIHRRTTC